MKKIIIRCVIFILAVMVAMGSAKILEIISDNPSSCNSSNTPPTLITQTTLGTVPTTSTSISIVTNPPTTTANCQHASTPSPNCFGYKCPTCDISMPITHVTLLKNVDKADCTTNGYTGDEICIYCNVVVKKGHITPIDKTNHQDVLPPCFRYDICYSCGETKTNIDAGLINCAFHKGPFTTKDIIEATCTEDGYSGDVYCDTCGEVATYGKIIEKAHKNDISTCVGQYCSVCNIKTSDFVYGNPKHLNTIIKNKNIPTHPCQDGYTGDVYCVDCQKTLGKGEKIKATQEHNDIIISEKVANNCYYTESQCTVCERISIKITIR